MLRDKNDIANKFNDYFINIGPIIADQIEEYTDTNFKNYPYFLTIINKFKKVVKIFSNFCVLFKISVLFENKYSELMLQITS